MAGIIALLTNPNKFFSDERSIQNTKKSILVFGASIATTALISAYYYSEKVKYYLELGDLSNIPVQILSLDYVIMSRLAYLFMASIIVLGVGRIFARVVNASHTDIKRHLNTVFYSFLVILVVNIASSPVVLSYPVQKYGIVGVSFEQVFLSNATLIGGTLDGKIDIKVNNTLIIAEKLDIKYFDRMGNAVKWSELTTEDIKTILENYKPRIILYDAKILTYGDRVFNITAEHMSFGEIKFKRTLDIERVLLNKEEIAENKSNIMIELVGAVIPFIAWIWFISVNAIGFKTIFQVSRRSAIAFGILCYIVLIILGIS